MQPTLEPRPPADRPFPRFLARADVVAEILRRSSGSPRPESPDVAARIARITRMLADAGPEVPILPTRKETTAAMPTDRFPPLPADLARMVVDQTRVRYLPTRLDGAGRDGVMFVLPAWLYLASGHGDPGPGPQGASVFVRARLFGDGRISVDDHPVSTVPEEPDLRHVVLRPAAPSPHRRDRLAATARTLLAELEAVLGASAADVAWLQRMVGDPAAAEAEGLRIWNDFVAACRVPPSFLVPGRSLSLADLLVLRRGGEGGRHRQTFADHHPWSTRHVLDGDDRETDFSEIDRNPANSITVAAKFYCCTGDSACDKAVRFARLVPRHRLNESLDRLFGKPREQPDTQIRSLLLEAHSQDGELLTHIGRDVPGTRARILHAIDVHFAYRDETHGSFTCAYALATLLVRTMIRNASDPDEIVADSLAAGLAAVSADSLAAFAARRLEDPSVEAPDPDVDTLDAGLLAFLSHVGKPGRPLLTAKQLVRFAEAARDRSVHRLELGRASVDDRLPPPPGWAEKHARIAGARVRPLASFREMAAEGREMRNCLREGRYQLAALLGRLALFSIDAEGERATLALRPMAENGTDGTIRYVGWELEELSGPANIDPGRVCTDTADMLKILLDEECPRVLPEREVMRQRAARDAMDRSRSFNRDAAAAKARWDGIHRNHLPRSFREVSPEDIVASYLP